MSSTSRASHFNYRSPSPELDGFASISIQSRAPFPVSAKNDDLTEGRGRKRKREGSQDDLEYSSALGTAPKTRHAGDVTDYANETGDFEYEDNDDDEYDEAMMGRRERSHSKESWTRATPLNSSANQNAQQSEEEEIEFRAQKRRRLRNVSECDSASVSGINAQRRSNRRENGKPNDTLQEENENEEETEPTDPSPNFDSPQSKKAPIRPRRDRPRSSHDHALSEARSGNNATLNPGNELRRLFLEKRFKSPSPASGHQRSLSPGSNVISKSQRNRRLRDGGTPAQKSPKTERKRRREKNNDDGGDDDDGNSGDDDDGNSGSDGEIEDRNSSAANVGINAKKRTRERSASISQSQSRQDERRKKPKAPTKGNRASEEAENRRVAQACQSLRSQQRQIASERRLKRSEEDDVDDRPLIASQTDLPRGSCGDLFMSVEDSEGSEEEEAEGAGGDDDGLSAHSDSESVASGNAPAEENSVRMSPQPESDHSRENNSSRNRSGERSLRDSRSGSRLIQGQEAISRYLQEDDASDQDGEYDGDDDNRDGNTNAAGKQDSKRKGKGAAPPKPRRATRYPSGTSKGAMVYMEKHNKRLALQKRKVHRAKALVQKHKEINLRGGPPLTGVLKQYERLWRCRRSTREIQASIQEDPDNLLSMPMEHPDDIFMDIVFGEEDNPLKCPMCMFGKIATSDEDIETLAAVDTFWFKSLEKSHISVACVNTGMLFKLAIANPYNKRCTEDQPLMPLLESRMVLAHYTRHQYLNENVCVTNNLRTLDQMKHMYLKESLYHIPYNENDVVPKGKIRIPDPSQYLINDRSAMMVIKIMDMELKHHKCFSAIKTKRKVVPRSSRNNSGMKFGKETREKLTHIQSFFSDRAAQD